jgi:hypothetical protein
MAHFAEIDDNGIVQRVLVISNDFEHRGADYLANDLGFGGNWIQTSYNNNFRKQFAGIGYTYDYINDLFISPKPFPSWILNSNFDWEAPIPQPKNISTVWDEDKGRWVETSALYSSWLDFTQPSTPSILIDTVTRSAGRYFNRVLFEAFPTAFLKWGYQMPHNPDSFNQGLNKFDVMVTVIRQPKDSIASSLFIYNATDDKSIIKVINQTLQMLKAIKNKKDNLMIFTFEQVTQNLPVVLQRISDKLGIEAQKVDENVLKSELATDFREGFYSVPIDNLEILNTYKTILEKPEFQELMDEVKRIYGEIL